MLKTSDFIELTSETGEETHEILKEFVMNNLVSCLIIKYLYLYS